MLKLKVAGLAVVLCALGATGAFAAQRTYEVTVTNVTKGQTFTPLLVVSHRPGVRLFELGKPAGPEMEVIAEAGNIAPMEALLGTMRGVGDTNTNGALLGPGETVVIAIKADGQARRLSVAGMLIPTNDTFVALNGVALPTGFSSQQFLAVAYDAGTEDNDQNCANIPGPRCGGEGLSGPAAGDEGRIHVSNGFHELGESDGAGNEVLGPLTYDWRNPVAKITVRRVR